MPRYAFVVLTNPVEGQDQAYNDWYTNTHLKDVLALDGFVAARRFRMVEGAGLPTAKHRYLAIYEAETDDLEATYQRLKAASGTAAMVISPALDRPATVSAFYEAITERVS